MTLTNKQKEVAQKIADRLKRYATDETMHIDINNDHPDMVLLKSGLSCLADSGANEEDILESVLGNVRLQAHKYEGFRSFATKMVSEAYRSPARAKKVLEEAEAKLNTSSEYDMLSKEREYASRDINKRFYGMLAGIGAAALLGIYALYSEPNETVHGFIADFMEGGQRIPRGIEGINRLREIVYRSGVLTQWIQGGIAASIGYHIGDKLTRAGLYIRDKM